MRRRNFILIAAAAVSTTAALSISTSRPVIIGAILVTVAMLALLVRTVRA